jgi:hypothetical protein
MFKSIIEQGKNPFMNKWILPTETRRVSRDCAMSLDQMTQIRVRGFALALQQVRRVRM